MRYLVPKSTATVHVLREGEEAPRLYCERRYRLGIDYDRAKITEERPAGPMCGGCERLAPHTDEQTREYWKFSEDEAEHGPAYPKWWCDECSIYCVGAHSCSCPCHEIRGEV